MIDEIYSCDQRVTDLLHFFSIDSSLELMIVYNQKPLKQGLENTLIIVARLKHT